MVMFTAVSVFASSFSKQLLILFLFLVLHCVCLKVPNSCKCFTIVISPYNTNIWYEGVNLMFFLLCILESA